jgi:hypothetical protein
MKTDIKRLTPKLIYFIVLLFSCQYNLAQTSCEKADEIISKAYTGFFGNYQHGIVNRIYKLCPESESINLKIAKYIISSNNQDYEPSVQYLNNVIRINANNVEAFKYRAAVYFCLGDFQNAATDYNKLNQLISKLEPDSSEIINHNNIIISYMDTVLYLGGEYLQKHKKKKYKVADVFMFQFALDLFKPDPFFGYKDSNGQSFDKGIEKDVLSIRINLNDKFKGFLKDNPDNPYSNWYFAEDRRMETESYYISGITKYPCHYIGSPCTFNGSIEFYEVIIKKIPNHIPSLLHLADIAYIDQDFDKAISYYKIIINSLSKKDQSSNTAMQSWRMIRRIEWLKSIDGTIKKNTLYYDKGRLDETISDIGTFLNDLGNSLTQAQANPTYSYVGIALNSALLIYQEARLNTNWVDKFIEKEDWKDLYQESLNDLPRHLNNSGFYSEQSLMMLSGIYFGAKKQKKKFDEYKYHVRALVDNVIVLASKESPYNKVAYRAGIDLINFDNDLTNFEKYKLIQEIYHLDELIVSNNEKSLISPEDKFLLETEKSNIVEKIKMQLK